MTDPVTQISAAAVNAPAGGAAQTSLDPAQTRMFARMMQGTVPASPLSSSGPGALSDAMRGYAAQLSGSVNNYEEMRRDMLASIDLRDPIKTMFSLTDHSLQAHMMFARLHISTGLASAATGLFGTLLKNQQ